jgi:alpha-mannosidase
MRSAADEMWRVRIVARSRRTLAGSVPVPALGWTAARPVPDDANPRDPVRVDTDGRRMSNGLLTITVDDDGTMALESADGVVARSVGRIEDGGDLGDSYNYGPPPTDTVVDTPTAVEVDVDLAGPIRGRLAVRRRYAWPRGLVEGGAARTSETELTEVTTTLELRADEPFVRVEVAFENRADDHRVRYHAPLPGRASTSHAEGQFAVVERGLTGEGGYREEPLATYPAHGWVDAGGFAVLLEHLAEYELVDGGRELALTVLRSTGLISRNDNPYRQDPAGPEIAIPDAQMHGRWHLRFALFPHAGDWSAGGVPAAAERYRHGLLVAAGAAADATAWPPPGAGTAGLDLEGRDVVLSSLRRRDETWLEARIVNLASLPRRAVVADVLAARDANLRGEPGAPIAVEDGRVELALGPAEIRTIQLRRTETATGRPEVLDAAGPRQSA